MNRHESVVAPLSWRHHGRITRISPSLVRAVNGLLAGGTILAVAGDDGAEQSLSIAATAAPRDAVVRLRLAAGVLYIQASVARDAGDRPSWRHYPDPQTRHLAWTLAAAPVLALLESIFGGPAEVLEIRIGSEIEGELRWLELTALEPPEGTGDVALPPPLTLGLDENRLLHLSRLPRRLQKERVAARRETWARSTRTLRVRLTGPQLPAASLRGLSVHDVIVLGRRSVVQAGSARVILEGDADPPWAWSVRLLDGGHAQVLDRVAATRNKMQQESFVSDETNPAPDAASAPEGEPGVQAHPLDRVPIQIEFDIGRLELPMGQLAQVEPGYVFQLPQALDDARVTVRLNGTVAGSGELVSIGDVLGVRLTAWTHGPDND